MVLRDPFSGKFTTRAKYAAALRKLARLRQRAFDRDDDLELARLTTKARKYQPLEPARRRAEPGRSVDYEFGMAYESDRRGGHNVGVNVRLTFDRAVSEREARRALELLVAGADVDDVTVNAVDWARPGKRTRSGDADDLASFADVISTVGVANLRAGGVKLDQL